MGETVTQVTIRIIMVILLKIFEGLPARQLNRTDKLEQIPIKIIAANYDTPLIIFFFMIIINTLLQESTTFIILFGF